MTAAAAPPRPAASLMLLRDTPGLQVLVGRRPETARAFPGATVFPGGKIEACDALWPGATSDPALAAAYAAVRELLEETGVFLAEGGAGAPSGPAVAGELERLAGGGLDFADLLRGWGRRPDAARLLAVARFVTPAGAPYRFDTWFFAAAATPAEAASSLAGCELEALRWAEPAALLAEEGVRLIPPTLANLRRLAAHATAAAALEGLAAEGMVGLKPPAAG